MFHMGIYDTVIGTRTVLNTQGGDLGCSVCLLELLVSLAQMVIWERAVKVSALHFILNVVSHIRELRDQMPSESKL